MKIMDYEDIIFEKKDGIARITINRPERYNACNQQAVHELIDAFNRCMDEDIGVEGLIVGKKSTESLASFEQWLQRRKLPHPKAAARQRVVAEELLAH